MSFVAFGFVALVGSLLCAGAVSYRRFRGRPNRLNPVEARRRRTLSEQALARAFASLYTNYADDTYPHFVLQEDREQVTSMIREFLRENRDRLGEMHFGAGLFEPGENALAENTVNEAIELFLKI